MLCRTLCVTPLSNFMLYMYMYKCMYHLYNIRTGILCISMYACMAVMGMWWLLHNWKANALVVHTSNLQYCWQPTLLLQPYLCCCALCQVEHILSFPVIQCVNLIELSVTIQPCFQAGVRCYRSRRLPSLFGCHTLDSGDCDCLTWAFRHNGECREGKHCTVWGKCSKQSD